METKSTRDLVEALNEISPLVKAIVKEARVNRGHPDIFGCVNGEMFVIENKTPNYWKNRKGHGLQLKELREWEGTGALTFMPKTDADREEILDIIKAKVRLAERG